MAKYEPLTITPEQVSALETEHGDVMVCQGPERAPWLCVVRRPTTEEAAAFVDTANNAQKKNYAITKLVTAISVYPKKDSEEWRKQYSAFSLFPFGVFAWEPFQEFTALSGAHEAMEK